MNCDVQLFTLSTNWLNSTNGCNTTKLCKSMLKIIFVVAKTDPTVLKTFTNCGLINKITFLVTAPPPPPLPPDNAPPQPFVRPGILRNYHPFTPPPPPPPPPNESANTTLPDVATLFCNSSTGC